MAKLNVEKCCAMSYRPTANINTCNISATKYFIEDCSVRHELKKLDSFSDLGVKFDNKLTFLEHMNEKLTKLTAF